jgi:hypothetical protein
LYGNLPKAPKQPRQRRSSLLDCFASLAMTSLRRGQAPSRQGQPPTRRGTGPSCQGTAPSCRGQTPTRRGPDPTHRGQALLHGEAVIARRRQVVRQFAESTEAIQTEAAPRWIASPCRARNDKLSPGTGTCFQQGVSPLLIARDSPLPSRNGPEKPRICKILQNPIRYFS